jgi:hypothetical protein
MVSSLIFTDFPLAVGAVWKYSANISYADPNDRTKLSTWTGFIIDKVVDKKTRSGGTIVFVVQEDIEPKPPQAVWRQSNTFEYIVSDNEVFKDNMKIYQWPLENNMQWKISSDFEYNVVVQAVEEVHTPYGNLEDCYTFLIRTLPDASVETFCPGIGFVMHSYSHHGESQDEKWILSSFTPGQP